MASITRADQPVSPPSPSDNWLGVEVRHLAALEAVARARSFGRAAEELGYTQSAVSQQIAALERIVGEKLIERPGGPRAISMTEAGELLLRHAEAIVARLDAARADMAALRAGETGTLRVATYQSISARVLPTVMRRFMGSWPGISLELSEPSNDETLYHGIESGAIDLGFCSLPVPDGPFDAIELLTDPHVLLRLERQPARGATLGLARRPRGRRSDRLEPLLERDGGRGRATCARDPGRLRVPVRRQHHAAGPRRCAIRGRPDGAARDPARRRPCRACSRSTRPCPAAASPSSGTATVTARRPPAPSSRSPRPSVQTWRETSSSHRPARGPGRTGSTPNAVSVASRRPVNARRPSRRRARRARGRAGCPRPNAARRAPPRRSEHTDTSGPS